MYKVDNTKKFNCFCVQVCVLVCVCVHLCVCVFDVGGIAVYERILTIYSRQLHL